MNLSHIAVLILLAVSVLGMTSLLSGAFYLGVISRSLTATSKLIFFT